MNKEDKQIADRMTWKEGDITIIPPKPKKPKKNRALKKLTSK